MDEPFTVHLVDDDPWLLRALSRLLGTRGYKVVPFASARQFLQEHDPAGPGCVVADLTMPELDGLQLHQALIAAESLLPVILISGNGDIPTSVRAMRAGAIDFLTKPVAEETLLEAIARARLSNTQARTASAEIRSIRDRLGTLTAREREVLGHVVTGRLNKQIASELGTVEKTIKVHRSRMMQKLNVRTVADLVRLAEKAGIGR